jgi:hypothetical protein
LKNKQQSKANKMEAVKQNYSDLKTQADAVIYFIQQLDIEMVDMILEEDRRYQDYKKNIFIQKLDTAFNTFIEAGDTFLNRYNGFCNSEKCNYKSKGCSFIGNNSGQYFDLITDVKNGEVQDIYQCHEFKCNDGVPDKNKIVKIDNFDIDPSELDL